MPIPPTFRAALVAAPAGSGKTTFLADWVGLLLDAGIRSAWLSLDQLDNAPFRFLAHLVAALELALPGTLEEAVRAATAGRDVPADEVVALLVRGLERDGGRVVLVLDDYHEIKEEAVHGVLDQLLRYVPASFSVVIGTRHDPPLALERLRVRGELVEVRWEDLRFSVDEGRLYLRGACGLELLEDQIRALCHRSEGWITALQLAAMSVAGAPDADRFVTQFTGAQRDMAAYLMGDVVEREPRSVRDFLLQSSVLEGMTAPLCNVVTGRNDAGEVLEHLVRKNLFTFALDEGRTWFRYHHLFLDVLRSRLAADAPETIDALHERASGWYERTGDLPRAISHALAARRVDRAARLVEIAGREHFRQGNFKELRRGIEALPEEAVRGSPLLCVLHAWGLAYTGEFPGARARIAAAERALPPANTHGAAAQLRAEVRVLHAMVATIEDDEPGAADLGPEVVAVLPAEEPALRAFAAIALGYVERSRGHLERALERFREAAALTEPTESSFVDSLARYNLGAVTRLLGRNREAKDLLVAAITRAEERLWGRTFGAAILRYSLALVLADEDRPAEAVAELSDVIGVLEASDCLGFIGMALVERARACAALGDAEATSADLARAREVAAAHGVRRVAFHADVLEGRLALRAGDRAEAARRLASAAGALAGARPAGVLTERQVTLAVEEIRLQVADGKATEGLRLAAGAIRSAVAAGRRRRMIELLIQQALAWSTLEDSGKAADKLSQALDLVGSEAILRPFLEAGASLVPVLRTLRERPTHRAVADAILGTIQRTSKRGGAGAPGNEERLHIRESKILELIARGLRNREIAERLFLSEETVKWYIKRLFARLEVRSRTAAVATARKLGLLP
jgi:LuxR family maltose regulon positive regulatory protein